MILLTARDLSRQFDTEPVFQNATFDLRPGERVGLVGPNGTGKTTLLKILAGVDHSDSGEVIKPPSTVVSLLAQHAEFPPERTLIEEAKAGLEHLYDLQHQATDLAESMATTTDATQLSRLQRRYDELQHELERLDAYQIDHRVDEVLLGLGFQKSEYDRPLVTFSGGQQNRVLLARLLLRAPEVMLLDEPTNHLDIASTEWLEDYLLRTTSAILLVSHDRYFLDKVTTRILEMHGGKVTDYKGNFSAYWTQREERQKVLQRTAEKQKEFIERTEDFINRNRYGQKHAQAADRIKKLERVERVEVMDDIANLPMAFGDASRTGDYVVEAKNLSKSFPNCPLFSDLTLRVRREDRLGLLGPNGCGKSTLLKTLLGELEPDSGTVKLGAGVEIGYYDQQLSSVDPELDAIEAVRPPNQPEVTPAMIRSILARFGIRGDMAFQKISTMSGGETSKVALARIAAMNTNVLVLDEPTNHLDLWARDSLEKALRHYAGTILFVSHDRYFLNKVANSVVVFEPQGWRYFEGNYSAYLDFRQGIERQNPELQTVAEVESSKDSASKAESGLKAGTNKKQKNERRKRKFPYRKVSDIEDEISEKEMVVEQLEADLADPDVHKDHERLQDTMEAYQELQEELESLYEHWEEATELN